MSHDTSGPGLKARVKILPGQKAAKLRFYQLLAATMARVMNGPEEHKMRHKRCLIVLARLILEADSWYWNR